MGPTIGAKTVSPRRNLPERRQEKGKCSFFVYDAKIDIKGKSMSGVVTKGQAQQHFVVMATNSRTEVRRARRRATNTSPSQTLKRYSLSEIAIAIAKKNKAFFHRARRTNG